MLDNSDGARPRRVAETGRDVLFLDIELATRQLPATSPWTPHPDAVPLDACSAWAQPLGHGDFQITRLTRACADRPTLVSMLLVKANSLQMHDAINRPLASFGLPLVIEGVDDKHPAMRYHADVRATRNRLIRRCAEYLFDGQVRPLGIALHPDGGLVADDVIPLGAKQDLVERATRLVTVFDGAWVRIYSTPDFTGRCRAWDATIETLHRAGLDVPPF